MDSIDVNFMVAPYLAQRQAAICRIEIEGLEEIPENLS